MKKKYVIIIALVLIIAACITVLVFRKPSYAPGGRAILPFSIEVLYDESHGNVWGLRDTGFFGYSDFAKMLMDHGLRVSRIASSLDSAIGKTEARRKILVLNVAKYARYSPAEPASLEKFVRAGGALLVIGEHENMYGSADFQNEALRIFGLELGNDFVGDIIPREILEKSGLAVLNQKAVSEEFACFDVRHLLAASVKSLNSGRPFRVLLSGYRNGVKKTIAAGISYGEGRVAVLGDSELFWNGDGAAGIGSGDNRLFLVRLFEWLAGGRLSPVKLDVPCSFSPGGGDKKARVFIDMSSYGRGIDDSPDGLKAFADYLAGRGLEARAGTHSEQHEIRVIAGPLSEVARDPEKKERVILFADSRQRITPRSEWGGLLVKLNARNTASIYLPIEKAAGLEIEPCFLTDGGIGKNYFDINFTYKNTAVVLHRAGSIGTRGVGLHEWLLPGENVWGETTHPGIENKNSGIPLFDASDIRRPVLAVYDARFLVIADSGIISNARSGEMFFQRICDAIITWIRTGRVE